MTLDDLLSRLEGVHRSGTGAMARCPGHDDREASLSADAGADERILIHCHAGCTFAQIVAALGLEPRDLMPENGRRRSLAAPSKTWAIRDAAGRIVAEHHRLDLAGGGKRFWWTRNGSKGLGGLKAAELPLYGSQRLKDVPADADVYVVEGEKASDSLTERGVLALGTVTGAKGTPGAEALSVLRGRGAILWPDFDGVGREHMYRVASALEGVAARVRFLSWGERPGDDAADYFARGGTVEGLRSFIFEEKKPSAEEVKAAALLDSIAVFIRRFVVLAPVQADALALWTLHTHAIDAADVTPYIAVTSAEMRSGKTRLLEVLELLVRSPWRAICPSEAVLFRKVSAHAPTLLLDETDAIFNPKAKEQEGLRALLNAGNRVGARVDRCVPGGKGEVHLESFAVFCTRVLAGIGKLPPTVADRSIQIRLKRRLRSEAVERFRFRSIAPEAAPLRGQIEAWAAGAVEALRLADPPSVPDALDDRQADGAEPLLAIADSAGGEWPERARRALVELCSGEGMEDDSLSVRLLQDCRTVFEESNVERIFSDDLCKALARMEEAPWPEWSHGKPITPRGLAKLLEGFRVRPKDLRIGDDRRKGYEASAFAEAWERYVPPVPEGFYPRQPRQVNNDAGFLPFSDPRQGAPVADAKSHESSIGTGIVADVADKMAVEETERGNGAAAEPGRVLL